MVCVERNPILDRGGVGEVKTKFDVRCSRRVCESSNEVVEIQPCRLAVGVVTSEVMSCDAARTL